MSNWKWVVSLSDLALPILLLSVHNRRCAEDELGAGSDEPSQTLEQDYDISQDIEKYLNELSTKKVDFVDPLLRKERQKLLELLESYKKLSLKLDEKCAEAATEGIVVPDKEVSARRAELRALLRPDLYRNPREEEKNKLIERFSSIRLFTEVDKVCPLDLTPIHCVSDKRQLEKDRFCQLVSSAPTRFHNQLGEPSPRFRRSARPATTPQAHIDLRESEKDRLARIFSTSTTFIRDPHLKNRILQKYKTNASKVNSLVHEPAVHYHNTQIKPDLGLESTQITSPPLSSSHLNPESEEMVRLGEYSPLQKYAHLAQERSTGLGENQQHEKLLSEKHQSEYRNFLAKKTDFKADKISPVSDGQRTFSSASTQTDESLTVVDSSVDRDTFKAQQPRYSAHPFVESSPREKLMSDLYGYRPHDATQEEKNKQIAYAQALEEQIKEKKRLEELRKKKEREEEELEERRYREQAERLQRAFDKEINEKLDFVLQRQVHDEALRRKLTWMEIESKEAKNKERISRLSTAESSSRSSLANNVMAPRIGLQVPERKGQRMNQGAAETRSATNLPAQRPPQSDWEESDWSQMSLPGVDLLREHRSQRERLQLPPIETDKVRQTAEPVVAHYVPSGVNDTERRCLNLPRQSGAHFRTGFDDEKITTAERLNYSEAQPTRRSRSPVVPAIRTETMIKRNSKILDDKWRVPPEGSSNLKHSIVDKDNILTQLGSFRRQLALEHHKLEERIAVPSSS